MGKIESDDSRATRLMSRRQEFEQLVSEHALLAHVRQSHSMMAIASLVAAWMLRASQSGNFVRLYLVAAFVFMAVYSSLRSNLVARHEKRFTVRLRHFRGWVPKSDSDASESGGANWIVDSKWLNDPPPQIFMVVAVASAAILADQFILAFGVD